MFAGRPIIGIIGGVGSGKSHVARLFGEMGCAVIDSDRQVAEVYRWPEVLETLRGWWGRQVIGPDGELDRRAVARIVFGDPEQRKRLEGLVHPLVGQLRDRDMRLASSDERVVGYVWDTPLLVEAGLDGACDAVVFVEAPEEERRERVMRTRGWSQAEWQAREKSQMALDNKRKIAKYIIRNTAGADEDVRSQVREVLSCILAERQR